MTATEFLRRRLLPMLGALALAGGVAACQQEPDESNPAVGAYSQAVPDDPEVLAAANFAARKLGKGGAQLASVDDASRQVVAGTNYRLTLTLTGGARWEAVVWHRLDGGMELTSSTQLTPLVQPHMRLEPQGIALTEGDAPTRHLRFGMAQAAVMGALAFRGPAKLGTNSECGEGPVQFATWADGLSLLFRNGRFGGWSVDKRSETVHTTDALHVGSQIGQVKAAGQFELVETSLGQEFTTKGIHGLLEGEGRNARVAAMWAGELSCIFR